MGDRSEPSSVDRPTWREPILAFGAVVGVIASAAALATVWGPLASYLMAVAAAVFLGVPYFVLRRRGEDFQRFGIALERIPIKHVGLGLLISAVIFPFYAAGHHVWETSVQQRDFAPSTDHYRQWSVELEAPSLTDEYDDVIQVRTVANRLQIEWSTSDHETAALLADGDRPFIWDHAGTVGTDHSDPGEFDELEVPLELRPGAVAEASKAWKLAPLASDTDVRFVVSPFHQPDDAALPTRLTLHLLHADDAEFPPLYLGTQRHSSDEPVELNRNYWWLLLWALTHLLVVALPEEYFYRGYLQTRFSELFGDTDADDPRTFLGFSRANWLTSVCFAIGHVLIPVGGALSPARAAVFFPSLVFGWLRDRTGSIVAPTIFHAAANMMVLVVSVHYF